MAIFNAFSSVTLQNITKKKEKIVIASKNAADGVWKANLEQKIWNDEIRLEAAGNCTQESLHFFIDAEMLRILHFHTTSGTFL